MASSLRKSVLTLASKFLNSSPKSVAVPVAKTILTPHIATRGLTVSLSKYDWHASNSSGILHSNNHNHRLCGCRKIHTEGDAKLVSFLQEEIENEIKYDSKEATTVEGWNVKTDGTGVILNKKFNDELLTVEFDVNHSVDDESPFEEEGQDESGPLVSKPPFEVLIEKKSGKKMVFSCDFTPTETPQPDDVNDMFYIIEVRIGDETSEDGIDKYYSHLGSLMDSNLYEYLMDMLDERGIDDDFINNLVNFATNYEHKLYINFLQDLKSIFSEK